MLGKAASKSASLMKDRDELTKQARALLAEIALPSFVCTHDHSKYLAMEQYYYNKERKTIINESEKNVKQVKSKLQQYQKEVVQERTCVVNAEFELDRAITLLQANSIFFWRRNLGSPEEVGAAQTALERHQKDFLKAESVLKETEQEQIQAEIVQARLMNTLSKQDAMDRYYYSKERTITCGSEANLVKMKSSALQQCHVQVEQTRTEVKSAENELRNNTKTVVILPVFGVVIGAGLIIDPRVQLELLAGVGGVLAMAAILHQQGDVGRLRSELGRRKKLYLKAQHSLKFEQEVDTQIDTETCTLLKHHGCYYCNKEGQRLQNAAEVNQAIVAKKSALQQCQERVEQARARVRNAERKLRETMFVRVGVGAVIGTVFGLIGGPMNAALMASTVATVATGTTVATVATIAMGTKYLVDKSALERSKRDYHRLQNSLREIEDDYGTLLVELDKFTHLKRPKLVPVEWRYYYRHRHIVLTDVTMNRPEIDFKMNTRLHHYFSKFRSFCFP